MRVTFGRPSNPQTSALAVFAHKDGVLTRGAQGREEGGRLARAIQAGRFDGEVASVAELLAPAGIEASRLLIVGLGVAGKADRGAFERIGGALEGRLLLRGRLGVYRVGTRQAERPGQAAGEGDGAEECESEGPCHRA